MSEIGEVTATTGEFEQGSIEAFAMQKVVDLWENEGALLNHSTSWKNVEGILRRGAYSEEFAERIKDEEYRRNYQTYHNPKDVSVGRGAIGAWRWEDILIWIDPEKVKSTPNGAQVENEELVRRRINPSKFLGLHLSNPTETDRLLAIAKEIWKEHPENALPIYGNFYSDELVWPKRMTHEEVVKMLSERMK